MAEVLLNVHSSLVHFTLVDDGNVEKNKEIPLEDLIHKLIKQFQVQFLLRIHNHMHTQKPIFIRDLIKIITIFLVYPT